MHLLGNLARLYSDVICILQVVFYGEEGVDAGGVRKVTNPAREIKMFSF